VGGGLQAPAAPIEFECLVEHLQLVVASASRRLDHLLHFLHQQRLLRERAAGSAASAAESEMGSSSPSTRSASPNGSSSTETISSSPPVSAPSFTQERDAFSSIAAARTLDQVLLRARPDFLWLLEALRRGRWRR